MYRHTTLHGLSSCTSRATVLLSIGCVAVLVGCSNEPFQFVKASGRVTYEDGAPLTTEGGLRLIFVPTTPPKGEDIHPPSAEAFPDEQGAYSEINSPIRGGGMVRGEQKVVIVYRDVVASQHVPKEYTSPKTTPLVVDTDDAPFDIKVPRP